jgi:hypothetical protein
LDEHLDVLLDEWDLEDVKNLWTLLFILVEHQ